MKTILMLLLAYAAFAQTHRVVFVHAPTSNSPSMNVTITSLPNTTGGTTVNLSSATEDWRFFGNAAQNGVSVARTDRQASGSGIQGVFNFPLGTDHNFYNYGHTLPALNMSWNDGTVSSSGTFSSLSLFPNSSYALSVPADNQVTKTFTSYWAVYNYLYSTPTKSGDDTVRFTFTLSDSSVSPITRDVAVSSTSQNGFLKIVVTYTAASDGQNLTMTAAKLTNNDGNTSISAIAATLDSAATGAITRLVPSSADFNSTLEACKPGETNVFPAGYTWTGNAVLVPRPLVSDGNGSYLHCKVRAADVNLTAGQRVMASEPTVTITTPNTIAVMTGFGPNICYWDFDGLKFNGGNTGSNLTYYYLSFGLGYAPDHTTTVASLPHDINLNHIYVAGNSNGTYSQYQGMFFDAYNSSVNDSLILNIISAINNPNETQGIFIQIGKNITLSNNEITASGENVMMLANEDGMQQSEANMINPTGGNAGMIPDGILITGNYLHKDPAWTALSLDKNLVECKNCRNSHITNNLLEYSFEGVNSQGQHGNAISVANRNGGGGGTFYQPYGWAHDVEIDHNIVRHVGTCLLSFGPYDDAWTNGGPGQAALNAAIAAGMGTVSNINMHHNYCDDISVIWTTPSTVYPNIYSQGQSGYYRGLGVRWGGPVNSQVQYNTFNFREAPGATIAAGTVGGISYNSYTVPSGSGANVTAASFQLAYTPDPATANELIDHNIFGWAEPGCDNVGSYDCLTQAVTVYTWTNNAMQNVFSSPSAWNSYFSGNNATYPGKWTGNVVSSDSSATVSGAGAPSNILSGEAAIRAGGR